MQVRNIVLSVVGALVLGMFFYLVIDLKPNGDSSLDEVELEKALASHKRSKSAALSSVNPPVPTRPKSKPRLEVKQEDKSQVQSPNSLMPPTPRVESDIFVEEAQQKEKMNEANRFYDGAEYESARDAALEILRGDKDNVRMLRIVVSSSCIMGDEDVATESYGHLPGRDQRQMARRCKRYGIEFEESQ